ncbi:DUF6077 domain-containing protein [Diplocloster modestus]|uniref:Uncharacterized protein n=1 Tax=Diplocloster modestus TaxID=2850322 RepID=A0ABS6K167_9FIRM|nr:DUF6077 domain-containing protein [Diplocloster modestus]MBU9724598.1 hypothetical protein [Diplocloster modestus]
MSEISFRALFLFLFAVVIPISCGKVMEYLDKNKQFQFEEVILYGFLSQLVIALLLGVICVTFKLQFIVFEILYLIMMLLIILCAGIIIFKKNLCVKYHRLDWSCLKLIVVLIIIGQILLIITHTAEIISDGTIEQLVTIKENGTIHQINPYTGDLVKTLTWKDFTGFYPELLAVWVQLMNISPSVFCHMVLPIILIPYGYMVYTLWARKFFPQDKKLQDVFMLFCCLLNLYGCYSVYTNSSFLLLYPWSTNHLLTNMILPLLLYNLYDEEISVKKKILYSVLGLLTAACLGSLKMGVIILLVGVWGGIEVCRRYVRIERNI